MTDREGTQAPTPRGVGRREVLRLAAAAPGVAVFGLPERVVISPGGWILLESDLR